MTYEELINCYPWIDLAWEIFKGVSPTAIALVTIFISEFFVRKRNRTDKKREMELQYLERILSWIHETRHDVFEISSSLIKVLSIKDIFERAPKFNGVLKQMTEMNKSIFILSDTYNEISLSIGYDFKIDQFKSAIHCYCEAVDKIGHKYLNYINTENAIKEINCMNTQVKKYINESTSLIVSKISFLYCKRQSNFWNFICVRVKKLKFHTKRKLYTPYGFNSKVEHKRYSQIGNAYYKKFISEKQNEKDDFSFNKYTEWRNYFKEKFLMNAHNTCNFQHYLNRKLRFSKCTLKIMECIAIPIYI